MLDFSLIIHYKSLLRRERVCVCVCGDGEGGARAMSGASPKKTVSGCELPTERISPGRMQNVPD